MPVFPKKPRGFGPPRPKKEKAKFAVGDRVESLFFLGYTGLPVSYRGLPVSAGALGDVELVQADRVFVNWGRNVKGWVYQDQLVKGPSRPKAIL
jgi:hypothetical protein